MMDPVGLDAIGLIEPASFKQTGAEAELGRKTGIAQAEGT
ncbi:hypothetical protein ANI01nite_16780 [Glutamicibacter nicotianae]|uniref:Uncharacterized protein n=1 Tax=Glutamicibacter nicotianae TaxID=37929 RepID=A0ABQ0RL17_GLUNI|nr:hypothetical protein ANI01nite_16780 [Glutamicibacter nicotianae]